MMCLAAKAMGYNVAVLDPTPNCPAGQVADIEIVAAYNDMEAIKKLAALSDVITYEFENIDYDALAYLEGHAYLPQGSEVLKISQHRFREKSTISSMGIPVADFELIESSSDLKRHIAYPSVLKTTTGGYDGKGQVVIRSEADMEKALKLADEQECILEKFMPFTKEISVLVARSTNGDISMFPIAENIHVYNIMHLSIAPARLSKDLEAQALYCARKIAENLNVVGVLAIEMFVVNDKIYVNELAPRPHNSGHYTIDACRTSQFEQHIRAVCGLPLGDPSQHTPVVMVNILGDHMDKNDMSNLSSYLPLLDRGKLHLYGKAQAVDKRKMGHVNILGDIDETLKAVNESIIWKSWGTEA